MRFAVCTGLIFVIALTGCNNDKRAEVFTLSHVQDFTVQAGLNTFETHFYVFPFVVSHFESQLDARDLTSEDIASVEPKFAELSTVFEDEDLDFIHQISVRLFDPYDPDFNREIFYLDPVPHNARKVIRPFPGLADVKALVAAPSMGIEVRLSFRRVTPRSYDMRLSFDLSAKAAE